MKTVINVTAGEFNIGVTIHTPESYSRNCAVFYLHGGGLLYGERDDLPKPYIRAFLDAGYTLFCMDYPLAPEVKLTRIHEVIFEEWKYLMRNEAEKAGIDRYFLFGRSAGAYLALILAKNIKKDKSLALPAGVLDFYGYYDMQAPFLTEKSVYYNTLPSVPEVMESKFSGGEPVTSGPKNQRFALYVYARQQGKWGYLLGEEDIKAPENSLSNEEIQKLPPIFITASSADQDVPYRISKELSRQTPSAVMKTVYYLEHDFDRDTSNPTGKEIYKACLEWMKIILEKPEK